jgi:hypothetical protein
MGFLWVLKFQAQSCSLGSKQILGKISQMIFQMVPLAAAPLNLFWVSKENQIESRLISIEPSLILSKISSRFKRKSIEIESRLVSIENRYLNLF